MCLTNTPNNSGDDPGKNLTGYGRLVLEAKSEGVARVRISVGSQPDLGKPYFDSVFQGKDLNITADWQTHEIDLKNEDLSNVINVMCWTARADQNDGPVVFYLRNVYFR
jgi:hypothetical protein